MDYGSAHTALSYDHAGRKTSMSDPDMGTWYYSYDASSNLTSQVDARGCVTTLSYDLLDRLVSYAYNAQVSCQAGNRTLPHRAALCPWPAVCKR